MDTYELIKKLAADAIKAEADANYWKTEAEKYKEWWHMEFAAVNEMAGKAAKKKEA